MRPPVATEFETRDADLAVHQISTAYSEHLPTTIPRSSFYYRQRRLDLGEVRIDSFATTLTTDYLVTPPGHPIVVRIVRGRVERATAGCSHRLGPGDVFLAARPRDTYRSHLHNVDVEIVGIDLSLFEGLIRDAEARLRRLSLEPLPDAAARTWNLTLGHLVDRLRDPTTANPLVLGQGGRLLAAALLAGFDPEGDAEQRIDRADANTATLRRAVAFVEANLDRDIGVRDIADACAVSVRAVQLAFRRLLDTTPSAYLRRARLDQVHAELRRADPGTATVTAIACRWGFTRASRFGADYRAAFGRLPSETLRDGGDAR